MGTLSCPCLKGKSPSEEHRSSTVAPTPRRSESTALSAWKRSSFYRLVLLQRSSVCVLARLYIPANCVESLFQVLCVGNLYSPDVRYSFNIPIEEHQEQFVWDPSGPWQECSHMCQGEVNPLLITIWISTTECKPSSSHLTSSHTCVCVSCDRRATEKTSVCT